MIDTSNIKKYVSIGKRDVDWYQECARTFVDIYGEENLTIVCKLFAATSIALPLNMSEPAVISKSGISFKLIIG